MALSEVFLGFPTTPVEVLDYLYSVYLSTKLQFYSRSFTAETHSFHRECYQTFVKAKTLGKRKYFVTKKSRTDDNYATRRKRKNSLKVDLVLCSETFLSFVKSIDFSYKNKQVIWCNIQQKLFPKQQVQK